ncbi:hypothetical protein GCM10010219_27800 [Streptomyces netropsis]|nr:hypothetical protein GCM10010219_27800 [Streptomyces netropsis]
MIAFHMPVRSGGTPHACPVPPLRRGTQLIPAELPFTTEVAGAANPAPGDVRLHRKRFLF